MTATGAEVNKLSPTNYQDPNQKPDFIQQILGQQPLPPPQQDTIPFAEDNRIADLEQQHNDLLPQNQLARIDPYARNKRTGANNTRSKKDKAGTALAYIAEFLNAASGGAKYQNPQQRARAEAIENYKLQAPRIIDELRILNQNKRASEALKSREEIEVKRLTAKNEIEQAKLELTKAIADAKNGRQLDALALKQKQVNLTAKYGNHSDPIVRALMAQLNTDYEQMASDPGRAKDFQNAVETNRNQQYLVKSLLNRNANQTVVTQQQGYRTGMSPYDGSPTTLPFTTFTKQPKPLTPEEQNTLRQLTGSLLPQSTGQQAPATTPAPDVSVTPASATMPQAQSIEIVGGQPQGQQQLAPLLPKPQVIPAPKPDKTDPAKVFMKPPQDKPVGAAAVQRTKPINFDSDVANDESFKKEMASYDATPVGSGTKLQTLRTSLFRPANTYESKVFLIQNTNQGIKTPYGMITNKTFARKGGEADKKEFLKRQQAVLDTNGMVDAVIRQYIVTKGDLLTGLQKNAAAKLNQYRDKTLPGRAAGAIADTIAGRRITNADMAIQFLTTKNFMDGVYARTGAQANNWEFKQAENYLPHSGLGADAFMHRVLVLALMSNRAMDRKYQELSTGRAETIPQPDLSWAERRASVIMNKLRQTQRLPQETRSRMASDDRLITSLLSPHSQVQE